MEESFWHKRWADDDIAFHEKETNPLLIRHFNKLSLATGSRVFIPLCGKTLDISWLLANGYHVLGAELSKVAIEQLFSNLGVEPKISTVGKVDQYSATSIDIFVGDIFALKKEILGYVDAIYDRAALVALPEKVRVQYSKHLMTITNKAPMLLICYVYEQKLMDGPPFSISKEEVYRHYGDSYKLALIESVDVPGGLKSVSVTKEDVWLLENF